MMKKTIIKILAIVLAVCCVLPMIAACAETQPSEESSTKRPRPTRQSETKAGESESDPEESDTDAAKNNRTKSSICFVGEEASSSDSVFFDSLEEAIAAYPEGATIRFCKEEGLSFKEPFKFPENGNFVLNFNSCQVDIKFETGFVLECQRSGLKQMQYVYYPHLEQLLKENSSVLEEYLKPEEDPKMGPYIPYLWVFGETDGMTEGRYAISNANAGVEDADPDFKFELVEDLSRWGTPYVIKVEGRYFYDFQEGFDAGESDVGVVKASVLTNIGARDDADNTFILPDMTGYNYRIAYDYHLVYAKFDNGVTYDDGAGGYCYYSSVDFLGAQASLYAYAWIWEDANCTYVPGKYIVTTSKEGDTRKSLDDGTVYCFQVGIYTFTHVDGKDAKIDSPYYETFIKEMEESYEKQKKLLEENYDE